LDSSYDFFIKALFSLFNVNVPNFSVFYF